MGCFTRDFMKFYTYVTKDEYLNNNPIVNGVPVFHWANCGTFILDNIEYDLIFVQMCLDELPDPKNAPVEQLDFSLPFADPYNLPTFIKQVMSGTSITEAMSHLTPYAQELILKDLEEPDIDIWTIIDRRAGVITDRYLGRTFNEVILFKPEILQNEEYPNVYMCSMEL